MSSTTANNKKNSSSNQECAICGDRKSINLWYGVVSCEACKKFFCRSETEEKRRYMCNGNKQCAITVTTRSNCQYCRYLKCKSLGMNLKVKASDMPCMKELLKTQVCAVCSQQPDGRFFGVVSCSACKAFFFRSTEKKLVNSYKCKNNFRCEIEKKNIKECRMCRYNKCVQVGMSAENCRSGRQPALLKRKLVENPVVQNEDSYSTRNSYELEVEIERPNKRSKQESNLGGACEEAFNEASEYSSYSPASSTNESSTASYYNWDSVQSSYDASSTNNFNHLYNYYYPVPNTQTFQANNFSYSYFPTAYTSYSNDNYNYYNQYQLQGYPFCANTTLNPNAFNFENTFMSRVMPSNPNEQQLVQQQSSNQTKMMDSIQFGIFNQNELKLALKDIDLLPDELLN